MIKSTYDARDNLTSRTDSRDHTTDYENDALNGLISTTDPLGQTLENLEYDDNDNMLRENNPIASLQLTIVK